MAQDQSYGFLFKIDTEIRKFPATLLQHFDHNVLSDEEVKEAERYFLSLDPDYYQGARVISYSLDRITDPATQKVTTPSEKYTIFVDEGKFKYKVVYCRDIMGYVHHGYAQFTLDHPIVDGTQDEDYRKFERMIKQDFNYDSISNFHVLVHCPV